MSMEGDEYGVVEYAPQNTSIDYLIKLPKQLLTFKVEKIEKKPEKNMGEKETDLKSIHSRVQKRVGI